MNIRRSPKSRAAFTLIELMLVSGLTTMLAIILAAVWNGFGKPLIYAATRAEIAREADLAVSALALDFGGTLPGPDGQLGSKYDGKLVGRLQPGGMTLRLCFDGGSTPNGVADWDTPDTVVTYELQDENLVRWDETAGTTFVVARYLQNMQLDDQGNGVEIRLTFSCRGESRTYTLVGLGP